MRTWEVIQQDGLFNYKMAENPRYMTVARMFHEAGLDEHDEAASARSPSKQMSISIPGTSAKVAPEIGTDAASASPAPVPTAAAALTVTDLEAPAVAEETKPADAAPVPAAEKPAEKPAEAKPSETEPAEAKLAEAKPAEAKPAETKPVVKEQPAELID